MSTGQSWAQPAGEGAPVFDALLATCPSRLVLEHITGRWGGLVLAALAPGPIRFNELRRRVAGISQKVLAQTLQSLVRDGLVERDVQSTFPMRVVYRLSPVGQGIAKKVVELVEAIQDRMFDIMAAQQRHDESQPPPSSGDPATGHA